MIKMSNEVKEFYRIQEEYDSLMDKVLKTLASKLWDDLEREILGKCQVE